MICPSERINAICPNNCNGLGECHSSGTCICRPGYVGNDCGTVASPGQIGLRFLLAANGGEPAGTTAATTTAAQTTTTVPKTTTTTAGSQTISSFLGLDKILDYFWRGQAPNPDPLDVRT